MNSSKIYTKSLPYDKIPKASAQLEYELQTYIGTKYGFTPRTHKIVFLSNSTEISMDQIVEGQTLAERFSDNPKDIPQWVWNEIRRIIKILYFEEGIEYIDITSYNFMIDVNNKIWIIDFGHAYYTDVAKPINWFLCEFIYDETNEFNPDFA